MAPEVTWLIILPLLGNENILVCSGNVVSLIASILVPQFFSHGIATTD